MADAIVFSGGPTVQLGGGSVDKDKSFMLDPRLGLQVESKDHPVINANLKFGLLPYWQDVSIPTVTETGQPCPPEWMDPTCQSEITTYTEGKLFHSPSVLTIGWSTPTNWLPVVFGIDVGARFSKAAGNSFAVRGNIDVPLGDKGWEVGVSYLQTKDGLAITGGAGWRFNFGGVDLERKRVQESAEKTSTESRPAAPVLPEPAAEEPHVDNPPPDTVVVEAPMIEEPLDDGPALAEIDDGDEAENVVERGISEPEHTEKTQQPPAAPQSQDDSFSFRSATGQVEVETGSQPAPELPIAEPPVPAKATSTPTAVVVPLAAPTPKQITDKKVAEDSGLLGALDANPELDKKLGDSTLSPETMNGVGGLIDRKGIQIGQGGLGSRGSGLGGGGTAEGLGGLGTKGRGSGASGYGSGGGNAQVNSPQQVSVGGDPIILGALDKSLIDAVIKRNMAQIRYCYTRELAKNPTLSGKITVKFVVAKDGTVSEATTKMTTMNNPAVENAINNRFMTFRFPEPKGGGIVIVSYPFIFSPG